LVQGSRWIADQKNGAALLAVSTVVVLPVALNYLGLPNVTDLLLRIARWPLLLILIVTGLGILYRYGPSRRKPRWQWLSIGSVIAAVAWLVSSALLSWYLTSFADYNATYGSLGAGIGMMMWMWTSIDKHHSLVTSASLTSVAWARTAFACSSSLSPAK
jgi:membrane protein